MVERADAQLLTRIGKTAEQVQRSTTERDELIVEASSRGLSLRTIAAAAGLSHMAVAYIVKRAQEVG